MKLVILNLAFLLFFVLPASAETVLEDSCYSFQTPPGDCTIPGTDSGFFTFDFVSLHDNVSELHLVDMGFSATSTAEVTVCKGVPTFPQAFGCGTNETVRTYGSLVIPFREYAIDQYNYQIVLPEPVHLTVGQSYYLMVRPASDVRIPLGDIGGYCSLNTFTTGVYLNYWLESPYEWDLRPDSGIQITQYALYYDDSYFDSTYGLTLITPDTNSYPFFALPVPIPLVYKDYTFKFGYNFDASMSSVNELQVALWRGYDPDFSTVQLLETFLISDLDPDSTGIFELTDRIRAYATSTAFYTVELVANSKARAGLNLVVAPDYSSYPDISNLSSSDLGVLGNTLRFLFVPSQSTLTAFLAKKDLLLNKAPFGYLTLSLNKIRTIDISSSTAPTLPLTASIGRSEIQFDLINVAQARELGSTESVNLLRSMAMYVLYLGFVFYVYFRITSIYRTNNDT